MCFHTQAGWQQPREWQHPHCTGLGAEPWGAMLAHVSYHCSLLSVPGSMDTQLVLDIKERAREWSCSHLGLISHTDGCNNFFCRVKNPKLDTAPAKHPCPWQQHLLVCNGGTSRMVFPHC